MTVRNKRPMVVIRMPLWVAVLLLGVMASGATLLMVLVLAVRAQFMQ